MPQWHSHARRTGAAAAALDMREPGSSGGPFALIRVAGFFALSILDSVVPQWIARVTVGKVVTASAA